MWFVPVVAEVRNHIVHDVDQQRNDSFFLIAVEHHVQQVSQHLKHTSKIYPLQVDTQ